MKRNILNKTMGIKFWGILAVGVALILSCNKDFPTDAQKLPTEFPNDTLGIHGDNRKVLYIIVDGAQGTVIKEIAPVNLMKIRRYSIYTWNALSGFLDQDTTLNGAWTSMMTGVKTSKSNVVTGFENNNLNTYPSLVTRLKEIKPDFKINAFSASALFGQNLTGHADINEILNSDQKVAEDTKLNLLKDSASVVISQFHSVEEAGEKYGFNASATGYVSAVNQVDAYIGDLLKTLNNRPNFQNEDWMVVIASNNSGTVNTDQSGDFTAFGDSRKNSFVFYYNPRFNSEVLPKPSNTKGFSAYNDSALLLTGFGSAGVNVTIPKNDMYTVKEGQSGTVEFKFKILDLTLKGSGYLSLAANGAGFYANPNGWSVWVDGNTIKFFMGDNSHYINTNSAAQVKDGNWHTVCFTYSYPIGSGKIFANLYIDGVLDRGDLSCATTDGIKPNNAITLGSTPNQGGAQNYTNYLVTDFRFWNTELPAEIVAQYNCQNEISSLSPYINNLMASYRLNDGAGSTVIKDESQNHIDALINDPGNIKSWTKFNEVSNAVCPPPDDNYYKAIITGVDIPYQIYQWLGVNILPEWNLDGQYWNSGYNDVTLPDQY